MTKKRSTTKTPTARKVTFIEGDDDDFVADVRTWAGCEDLWHEQGLGSDYDFIRDVLGEVGVFYEREEVDGDAPGMSGYRYSASLEASDKKRINQRVDKLLAKKKKGSKRSRLLALAASIGEPLYTELGSWVGGLEVAVATKEGAGLVNIQDGSRGPSGPARIPAAVHVALTRALRQGDEAVEDLCEEFSEVDFGDRDIEWEHVVEMVRSGAKPDIGYYWMIPMEGEFAFSTDESELSDAYAEDLTDGADLEPWEEMDDDELESRLADFGLRV